MRALLEARYTPTALIVANTLAATFAVVQILREPIGLLDDAFIYLHIADNIVQTGRAQYFPIADSWALLASSPLRLASLVPGTLLDHLLLGDGPGLEAARRAWAVAALLSPLAVAPLWSSAWRLFGFALLGYWAILIGLPTAPSMEAPLIFLTGVTFIHHTVRTPLSPVGLGVSAFLTALVRPELGLIAITIAIALAVCRKRAKGLLIAMAISAAVYTLLALSLRVYPIPTTILSKDLTSQLQLFGYSTFLQSLQANASNAILATPPGSSGSPMIWLILLLPAVLSARIPGARIAVTFATAILALLALSLPGNYVWYSENYLAAVACLYVAVGVCGLRRHLALESLLAGGVLVLMLVGVLTSGFGKPPAYPWNEGTGRFLAYTTIGASARPAGTFLIDGYSAQPMRISMCEIGIPAYFAGPDAWIHDKCGLAQPGELLLRGDSPVRHMYPSSLLSTGDEQLEEVERTSRRVAPLVDVWGLSSREAQAADEEGWIDRDRYIYISPPTR